MLLALLVGLHIVVSLILILVVLLQTGKSADLAGAFGGGGSQTAFGSRGAATFLSKMTTSAAVIFMVTSFSLAILSARGRTSVLDQTGVPVSGAPVSGSPAVPAAPPDDDQQGSDSAPIVAPESRPVDDESGAGGSGSGAAAVAPSAPGSAPEAENGSTDDE